MAKPFKALRDPKLDFDDILSFGKYQGCSVKEILKDRPEYVAWLINNTSYTFTQRVIDVVDIYCPKIDRVFDNFLRGQINLLTRDMNWDDDIPF